MKLPIVLQIFIMCSTFLALISFCVFFNIIEVSEGIRVYSVYGMGIWVLGGLCWTYYNIRAEKFRESVKLYKKNEASPTIENHVGETLRDDGFIVNDMSRTDWVEEMINISNKSGLP